MCSSELLTQAAKLMVNVPGTVLSPNNCLNVYPHKVYHHAPLYHDLNTASMLDIENPWHMPSISALGIRMYVGLQQLKKILIQVSLHYRN